MALMGDDRSKIVEPMHRLDVDAEVWREVPNGADGRGHVAGLERCTLPVIDGDPVRRRNFVPVERGVATSDNRPCVRVGGRFACEVSGIELGEGGVDVVNVEPDARHDPLVGLDLDDAEHLDEERLRLLVKAREAGTSEGEALPASGNDV